MNSKKFNKKILFPIITLLLFCLCGTSLGTFAWFAITQNIIMKGSEEYLDVKESSADLEDIKLYLYVDDEASMISPIELTDNNGSRWTVLRNGLDYYYQEVTSGEANTYGILKFNVVARTGSPEVDVPFNELIPHVGKSVVFTITGGKRTRISTELSNVYSLEALDESIDVVVTIKEATSTSVTYQINPDTIYYSIAGGISKNTGIKSGDICTDIVDINGKGVGEILINGGSYKRIEYVQSTGKEYIDTGYSLSSIYERFVVEAEIVTPGENIIFGTSDTKRCNINLYQGSLYYRFGGASYNSASADTAIKHKYELGLKSYVDNRLIYTFDVSSVTNDSIFIFAANLNSTPVYFARAKIYSFQIYNDDLLMLNLIPMLRQSDGAVGMYDTIFGTFYTNDGSGEFIPGPIL